MNKRNVDMSLMIILFMVNTNILFNFFVFIENDQNIIYIITNLIMLLNTHV